MELTTTKSELLNILNKLKPGLASKAIVEQSTHFIFLGKIVATFSDQIAVIYPFQTPFPFSVKGEEFHRIISGIEEEELTIYPEENHLIISSEGTVAGIDTIVDEKDKVEHLIESLSEQMKKWKKLPEDFIQGMFLTMFSAAKNLASGTLACVSVDGKNIFSCDTIRASWYTSTGEMPTCLLPAKDVQDLVKYPNFVEYCESDNWMHFRTKDKMTFSVKKVLDKFTDIKKFFLNASGDKIELPEKLAETLKSISFLAEGDMDLHRIVTITLSKGKIVCKAKKEIGWVEKKIACAYKGKQREFMINPLFLSEILNRTNIMILSETAALFKTDNFQHMILLPVED